MILSCKENKQTVLSSLKFNAIFWTLNNSSSTELPPIVTIDTGNKCSHRFISTPRLQLIILAFPLPTPPTLKLISLRLRILRSLGIGKVCRLHGHILLAPSITGHLGGGHGAKAGWGEGAREEAVAEVGVGSVFEVEVFGSEFGLVFWVCATEFGEEG